MCNCKKTGSVTPSLKTRTATKPAVVTSPAYRRYGPPETQFFPASLPEEDTNLTDAVEGETLEEKCFALGQLLGLNDAVPENVFLAAIEFPLYGQKLLAKKNNPAVLEQLLNNPPELPLYSSSGVKRSYSNNELMAKAAKALVKWGFSGFKKVSDDVLQRREAACLACPNLSEPESNLQRFTASSTVIDKLGYRTGNKVCGVCGCVVKNKMKLSTETCPVASDTDPAVNRWGEEI